jgi:N-alpha-acetyltransferase 50
MQAVTMMARYIVIIEPNLIIYYLLCLFGYSFFLSFFLHFVFAVSQLRKVNVACFPVSYQETYYTDVVACKNEGLCKLAYYNGFVVGAACARIEPIPQTSSSSSSPSTTTNSRGKRIYIMTLGVLAAYRGRGIGTQLIQSILDYYYNNNNNNNNATAASAIATKDKDGSNIDNNEDSYSTADALLLQDVVEICLHVQISNHDAFKFYKTRFGFVQGELVENYYKRIDPPHCYRLYKSLIG